MAKSRSQDNQKSHGVFVLPRNGDTLIKINVCFFFSKYRAYLNIPLSFRKYIYICIIQSTFYFSFVKLQQCFLIVLVVVNMFHDCPFMWNLGLLAIIYVISLLILFSNFYIKSYVTSDRHKAQLKEKTK